MQNTLLHLVPLDSCGGHSEMISIPTQQPRLGKTTLKRTIETKLARDQDDGASLPAFWV